MKITTENINALMGAHVLAPDGDKFGTVGQVFEDQISGRPSWISVRTGLFGLFESFVPLDDADWDGADLHVPYEKALVKDAPQVDVDNDEPLSATEEQELYDHYRLAYAERTETGTGPSGSGPSGSGPSGSDASGSEADSARFRKHVPSDARAGDEGAGSTDAG